MPAKKKAVEPLDLHVAPPKKKTPVRRVKTRAETPRGMLREVLEQLLQQPVQGETADALGQMLGRAPGEVTALEAMAMAQIAKAIGGDGPAFAAVRDTVGEKPTDKAKNLQVGATLESYLEQLQGEEF